ncbi:MAG: hypothetical protein DRQ10_05375 [Candidatus Hydrothermota bacterium]|nr:MAG: hypothetical protein DRQ10_05375 [Candidatus Hydrothermae bacterium]
MPNPEGTEVRYFVWAIDDSNATAQSDTFSYFVQTSGGNPIPNAGFEQWSGGDPVNWYRDNGITWSEELSVVHSGQRSLKIVNADDRKNIYSDTVQITGGHRYHISFWVLDNVTGRARIFVRWFNESGYPDNDWSSVYSTDSPQWQRLEWEWTAPPNAQKLIVALRFYTSNEKSTVGPFYVDDVELSDLSSNSEDDEPHSLLPCHGFKSVFYDSGGRLHLRFDAELKSNVMVSIYRLNGTRAFRGEFFVNSDALLFSIPLESGIYFVKADIGARSFVEKVVVLR